MFAWSQFSGTPTVQRVPGGRRVELLGAVERAHLERVLAGREVGEHRRVEALQPHLGIAAVEPALVLQERRRRAVVDAGEGEGGRAAGGQQRRLLDDERVRRIQVRALEHVRGGRRVDAAVAVDRAHLERVEAFLEQLGLPARVAGLEQVHRVDRLERALRLGRLGQVVLDQAALVDQLVRRRGVVGAREVEGARLEAVLDRARDVLRVRRRGVRIRRRRRRTRTRRRRSARSAGARRRGRRPRGMRR